ncbi:MAG: hypothetical protein MUO50_13820 [Longimicrobiales bacterium]|nr:hypothetical protein [Longimicrobiales bacterium]
MVKNRSEGMALPLLLLLLLALTALGQGTLLLARRELQTVWAFRHALRAGQAAEAALWVGLREGGVGDKERTPWKGYPIGSGESEDGLVFRSVLRWLDREFFLLEGTGSSRGWSGERRRARVGWSLFPEARLGALAAGGETGGGVSREGGGLLETGGFFGAPENWPTGICAGYRAVLDSLFPTGPPPSVGPLAAPDLGDSGAGASIPPLGLLSGSQLLEELGTGASGPHLPHESVRGCPGEDGPVMEGTEGSLSLDGGRTCGLLVVAGDLRLRGDASFQGLALVGGELILEGGSVLEGMVRVRKGIRLRETAVLRPRACPVLWALEGLPDLQRPRLLPGARTLTGF